MLSVVILHSIVIANVFHYYLHQSRGYEIKSVCLLLSFSLSVHRITTKLIGRSHWYWCYDWAYQSEEPINFWWWSGPGYGFWITFLLSSPLSNRKF